MGVRGDLRMERFLYVVTIWVTSNICSHLDEDNQGILGHSITVCQYEVKMGKSESTNRNNLHHVEAIWMLLCANLIALA